MMLNLGAIFTLLFTALRLIGTVRWSWFWIFMPVNVGYLCDITVRIIAYLTSGKKVIRNE